MVNMTATKMLSYANRRLIPGEDFEAKSQRDMKVLLATRKAKLKRPEVSVPPPPPPVAAEIEEATAALAPDDELTKARAAYEEKLGKRPYHGWDAETLAAKIEAAEGTS